MKKLVALTVLVLAGGLAVASRAVADDTVCSGFLTGPHDNVVVPAGANCHINGAIILGNLILQPGSGRTSVVTSEIHGNVQGDRFAAFFLVGNPDTTRSDY
jgi:hypothetical protein